MRHLRSFDRDQTDSVFFRVHLFSISSVHLCRFFLFVYFSIIIMKLKTIQSQNTTKILFRISLGDHRINSTAPHHTWLSRYLGSLNSMYCHLIPCILKERIRNLIFNQNIELWWDGVLVAQSSKINSICWTHFNVILKTRITLNRIESHWMFYV